MHSAVERSLLIHDVILDHLLSVRFSTKHLCFFHFTTFIRAGRFFIALDVSYLLHGEFITTLKTGARFLPESTLLHLMIMALSPSPHSPPPVVKCLFFSYDGTVISLLFAIDTRSRALFEYQKHKEVLYFQSGSWQSQGRRFFCISFSRFNIVYSDSQRLITMYSLCFFTRISHSKFICIYRGLLIMGC